MKNRGIVWGAGLLWIMATGVAAAESRPPDKAHFYFVQITDVHCGAADYAARLEKIVNAVNQLPMEIEFTAVTGDITADAVCDPAVMEKSLAILKKLRAPVHYLPGNHDVKSGQPEATQAAYKKYFGELSTRAEYQKVVCLFMYTEPLRGRFAVPGYDPWAWLDSQLQAAQGKPVLLFQHSPLVADFYNNTVHSGCPTEIQADWWRRLEAYPVTAVIAGHFHRDELHWQGKVPVYVAASVAGFWGRQATFRLYEYQDGRVGYWTQYIE